LIKNEAKNVHLARAPSSKKLLQYAVGWWDGHVKDDRTWRARARELAAKQLPDFGPEAVVRAWAFYGQDMEAALKDLNGNEGKTAAFYASMGLALCAIKLVSDDPTKATAHCSFTLDAACASLHPIPTRPPQQSVLDCVAARHGSCMPIQYVLL
jgi:hypothetical protein